MTVNEIITGVTIALGSATRDQCPVFDRDGSGDVAINELIAAVQSLLTGCARGLESAPGLCAVRSACALSATPGL